MFEKPTWGCFRVFLFVLTWPLFSSVGNSSYRKCCNTVLWVIMTDHHIALTLLFSRSGQTWHGPLPLISADHGSQQFNLRSIWALWNDNDCNICELLWWCTCKHIFPKQGLIYEWLRLTLGGNLWLSTGWQLLVPQDRLLSGISLAMMNLSLKTIHRHIRPSPPCCLWM